MDDSLELTAITKLRHAALWELSKRLGGQNYAADQCFVTVSIFNRWTTLRSFFPMQPKKGYWKNYPDRWQRSKEALESLTNQTIEQLWPESLRNLIKTRKLVSTVEQVIEVPYEALLTYATVTKERLTAPSPSDRIEHDEIKTAIAKTLKTLPYREREIIKLRYGLNGEHQHTLQEVAYIFKSSKERIRQLEARAIRYMQQFNRATNLIGYLE